MSKQLSLTGRSRAILREAARQAALPLTEEQMDELLQRVSLLEDIKPNISSKLKAVLPRQDFRPSGELALEMASNVRWVLGTDDFSPLYNLPTLLDIKLNVLTFPIEQDRIAGACALVDNVAFIFVSSVRMENILFSCAHELAHLLVLSAQQKNKAGAIIDPADSVTSPLKSRYELFADTFAQELLIPNRGLALAIKRVRNHLSKTGAVADKQLLYLARIFGVSLYTMAKKCERAGLLPKGAATKLNQRLIEDQGGPEVRADETGVPPRPQIKVAPVPYSLELALLQEIYRRKTASGAKKTRSRQNADVSRSRP